MHHERAAACELIHEEVTPASLPWACWGGTGMCGSVVAESWFDPTCSSLSEPDLLVTMWPAEGSCCCEDLAVFGVTTSM